jgi:hypothetical protein
MNATYFCEINLDPQTVVHFLLRNRRVSAPFHGSDDGVPVGEIGLSRSAFRLNHLQKRRA